MGSAGQKLIGGALDAFNLDAAALPADDSGGLFDLRADVACGVSIGDVLRGDAQAGLARL